MNTTDYKVSRQLAKRAREQRNASTTNEEFDYWQDVMEHYENKLKTGETNGTTN